MAEQLALDIEYAPDANISRPPSDEVDLAESIIRVHGGDAKAAIRELLLDADFLRDQLHTASCIMSRGMAYGWRPKYERI